MKKKDAFQHLFAENLHNKQLTFFKLKLDNNPYKGNELDNLWHSDEDNFYIRDLTPSVSDNGKKVDVDVSYEYKEQGGPGWTEYANETLKYPVPKTYRAKETNVIYRDHYSSEFKVLTVCESIFNHDNIENLDKDTSEFSEALKARNEEEERTKNRSTQKESPTKELREL